MGAPNVGPAGVTVYSPTARNTLSKVGKLEVADAGTAFAAFGLPSGALVLGVYIFCFWTRPFWNSFFCFKSNQRLGMTCFKILGTHH